MQLYDSRFKQLRKFSLLDISFSRRKIILVENPKVAKIRNCVERRVFTNKLKEYEHKMKVEFREEQKFTQWWLWLILIGIEILLIFGIYKQLFLGEKFGDKPMSDVQLINFCVFISGIIALSYFTRLKTEIDQNGIRMIFFPFVKKEIHWKEIKKAEIVNYGFVGGWGIRLSSKYGTVYNTRGNKGLAIELTNGKKILIGTQKENELNKIMEKEFCNTTYN